MTASYVADEHGRSDVAAELQRYAAALRQRATGPCPRCNGQGWYIVTGSEHDPRCDGSCLHCPVPVPQQEQCQVCNGTGRMRTDAEALAGVIAFCQAHPLAREDEGPPSELHETTVMCGGVGVACTTCFEEWRVPGRENE